MCFAIYRLKLTFPFFLLFFIFNTLNAQTTSIPDPVFENFLETHDSIGNIVPVGDPNSLGDGTDGNGLITTAAISNLLQLNITNYNIANFDGIEDFISLTNFAVVNNQALSIEHIDFSNNTQLISIQCFVCPNITSIDITQNESLDFLDLLDGKIADINLSNNSNLTFLRLSNQELSSLILSNNTKIETLSISGNLISEINLSSLELLKKFYDYPSQLLNLDFSDNSNLETVLVNSASNLVSVNLKNGNNSNLNSISLINNPLLTCILVDVINDSNNSSNWSKDASATYIENSITLTTNAQDDTIQYDDAGYLNDIENWLDNKGGATASVNCGDIMWSESSNFFLDEASNSIIYEVSFFATDIFGIRLETFATLTVENINKHFNDPFYGSGSTICLDTFDLNSVITDIDPNASLNDPDVINYSFSRIANGEPNEGPSGGTYNNTLVDFPDSGAGSFSYLFEVTIEKIVNVYNPETGDFEADSITEQANITLNDKTVPMETQELEDIRLCPNTTISSIQDLSDLLVYENLPEGYSFNPNQYWTPNIYSGAGTYTFDPSAEFPGCSAIPISINILEPLTIEQYPEPLVIVYNPDGNDAEINTWLNNNGGAIVSGCDDQITWSYNIDYYEIDSFSLTNSLICELTLTAKDSVENLKELSTTIEYLDFPIAGETDQGDTVCEKSLDLNGINGIDFESSTYSSSIVNLSGDGTITGLMVDFPDSGAGSFTYAYTFDVTTTVNIGTKSLEVSDSASWILNDVTVPYDPGEDKTYTICEGDTVTLMDLFNQFVIVDDIENEDNNPNPNPLNPDNYWFVPSDPNDTESPLVPISAYSGPGVYTFNAEDFLPQCGGKPATVTVTETPNVLDIKVYLQGASMNPNSGEEDLMRDDLRVLNLIPETSPYDSSVINNSAVFDVQGPNAIVDWVLLEFRDGANNTSILNTKSVLLQRDGDIVNVDGASLIVSGMTADYYLTVKHRNHLGIMTANPISLDCSGNTIIDFTDANNIITFGTNAQTTFGLPTNKLGMWTGDTNSDGRLNYLGSFSENPSIRSQVFDDPNNSLFGGPPLGTYASLGYFNTDIDLDGKTKYLGSSGGVVSDVLSIRNNTFNNPSNSLFGGPPISTFVFIQQLPEGAND
tara:strand:- start:643 stop:4032 length:3390 start_codon:yes stop_codon:yes gene_type:complete